MSSRPAWIGDSAAIAAALSVAGAAVIAAFTWFTREYTHDDFFFAYVSWMRGAGLIPGRDFYLPNFTPLAEAFAPMFRWWPESFAPLIAARALMLATAAALVLATYRVARLLGGTVRWSLIAISILVWYPDFFGRAADIRSDNIAAVFLLITAAELLGEREDRVAIRAGLALGAALLCAYKVAFAYPIAAIIIVRRSTRRWTAVAKFTGAAAAPQILYQLYRISIDGWPVVEGVWRELSSSVASGPAVRLRVAARFVEISPIAFIAIVSGIVGFARGRSSRAIAYAISVSAFVVMFGVANPFLFPYNFVILLPLCVPLVAGIERLVQGKPQTMAGIATVLAAVLFGFAPAVESAGRRNDVQVRLVQWIWQATAPDERVFDWQGIHFGRQGIFHWWNYTGLSTRYQQGWYRVADELRADRVSMIVDNYRLAWLTPRDQAFVTSHYVRTGPCIFSPGLFVAGSNPTLVSWFEIFVPGDYRVVTDDPTAFLVDGRPPGRLIRFAAGKHELRRIDGSKPHRFAIAFTTPRRAEAGAPPCAGNEIVKGFR